VRVRGSGCFAMIMCYFACRRGISQKVSLGRGRGQTGSKLGTMKLVRFQGVWLKGTIESKK